MHELNPHYMNFKYKLQTNKRLLTDLFLRESRCLKFCVKKNEILK